MCKYLFFYFLFAGICSAQCWVGEVPLSSLQQPGHLIGEVQRCWKQHVSEYVLFFIWVVYTAVSYFLLGQIGQFQMQFALQAGCQLQLIVQLWQLEVPCSSAS